MTAPDHAAALAALDEEIAKDGEGLNCVILATDKAKALAALYRADVALDEHRKNQSKLLTEHGRDWWLRKLTLLVEARKAALAAVADKLGEGK